MPPLLHLSSPSGFGGVYSLGVGVATSAAHPLSLPLTSHRPLALVGGVTGQTCGPPWDGGPGAAGWVDQALP